MLHKAQLLTEPNCGEMKPAGQGQGIWGAAAVHCVSSKVRDSKWEK
jgi:hypothetical protein